MTKEQLLREQFYYLIFNYLEQIDPEPHSRPKWFLDKIIEAVRCDGLTPTEQVQFMEN